MKCEIEPPYLYLLDDMLLCVTHSSGRTIAQFPGCFSAPGHIYLLSDA